MKKISLTIVMMLVMSSVFVIMSGINGPVQAATTWKVDAGASIQDAINASKTGDTIIVNSTAGPIMTYFDGDIEVNKSITLESRNGSLYTQINGTVNITNSSVTFGGENAGFTVYQSAIGTPTTHAVNISTNGSLNNIRVEGCIIIGGYDGVHIGMPGATLNETTGLTIYNCNISDVGRSAIRAGPGQLVTANFSVITAYNTSNSVYGDIICIDGGNNVLINNSFLYDSSTKGGMGINSTGASNALTNFRVDKNEIYNVGGYSPICIVSTASGSVGNVRITFNELENNTGTYTEAAIRFDNISGQLTATNITVMYNNIDTSGNDIEEQFGVATTYKNWTGNMTAYFNWYGSDAAGSFNDSTHLYAEPWLHLGSAAGDIWTGTDYLEGTLVAGTLNATAVSDVFLGMTETINSGSDVVIVVYPYGLGGASNPLGTTYPIRAMHNYKEIGVSNTSSITFPVNITVYYDTADLAIRGWSESRINGLMFYNESSSAWEEFNSTGKNTTYNASGYSGFVWGVAYTESQLTGAVICINYNAIVPEDEGAAAVTEDEVPLDSDGDGYSDAEEIIAGSDPYDAASTPVTVAAALTFLGLDWYWWIAIVVILIFFIIAVYFALRPKAWKKFKKTF